MSKTKAIIIGSGIGALGAAPILASRGFDVTIVEKNHTPGGRIQQISLDGFTFDTGPSWYMMPEVFTEYFKLFGKDLNSYLDLVKLDPSYRIFFLDGDVMDISPDLQQNIKLFENYEKGAGQKLKKFIAQAELRYNLAVGEFIKKPYLSYLADINWSLVKNFSQLGMLGNYHKLVTRYFKHPKLIQAMEWIITFIGCSPYNASSMYSLMNYADMGKLIWYPQGGMYKLVEAFVSLAKEQCVKFVMDTAVKTIEVDDRKATALITDKGEILTADIIISNADYQYTEMQMLPEKYRSYDKAYWNRTTLSPSALLFFLGFNKKIPNILHHTFAFKDNWEQHFADIYDQAKWPVNPNLYFCAASKTDASVAPAGQENIFALIPIAAGLKTTAQEIERLFEYLMTNLEKISGTNLREHLVVYKYYSVEDYVRDYNAFKGHAFGLANTLNQTAFWRPKMRSKKIKNLFYTGCMTNPGVGVPTSLISGQVVANLIVDSAKNR